jgi:hypothetical protein
MTIVFQTTVFIVWKPDVFILWKTSAIDGTCIPFLLTHDNYVFYIKQKTTSNLDI